MPQTEADAIEELAEIQDQFAEEPYTTALLKEQQGVLIINIGGVPATRHAEQRSYETFKDAHEAASGAGFESETTHGAGTGNTTVRIEATDADTAGEVA